MYLLKAFVSEQYAIFHRPIATSEWHVRVSLFDSERDERKTPCTLHWPKYETIQSDFFTRLNTSSCSIHKQLLSFFQS